MTEYYLKFNKITMKVCVQGVNVRDLLSEADKLFCIHLKEYYEWNFDLYIDYTYINHDTDLIYINENDYNTAYDIKL